MHTAVHGIAPFEISNETAQEWFYPSERMIQFVESKGYDVELNLGNALKELEERPVRGVIK